MVGTALNGAPNVLEQFILCALVREVQPKVILEVGTFKGATTWHIHENAPPDAVIYTIDLPDDDNGQAQTTAILKMEQANVTTIIMWSDVVPITVEMENADSNAYYPEWVMLNSNGADFNGSARLFPQAQASHMFGMSGWELPRPFSDTDCYKAYKTVDPANTPDQLACTLICIRYLRPAEG